MNGNAELLNFIYQNAEMGVNTIHQILEINEDSKFADQLNSQLKEYQEINLQAKQKLNENGCEEKGISGMEKIRAYLMINFQTLTEKGKSPSHIAEMMIIGSNMGVIDAIKKLREYNEADKEIIKLMERLLKFEEENIKKLKEFL